MKVIGAGFGRTGTLTLKLALEELGFGPCYHMAEVFSHPSHVPVWEAATRGEPVDWAALFDGWGATVDWPACAFHGEILASHPEAKVVLGVRDPERWYQSCRSTIYLPGHLFPLSVVLPRLPGMGRVSRMAVELIWRKTFGGRFEDKAHAIRVYQEHIDAARRDVPPEKLLVFDVRDGWAPLCAFLGVPVPSRPFPHANDGVTARRAILAMNVMAWGVLLLPVVGLLWWASS
ncbi:MAG: sulfotransferase family protein [Myxococcota bacterium]